MSEKWVIFRLKVWKWKFHTCNQPGVRYQRSASLLDWWRCVSLQAYRAVLESELVVFLQNWVMMEGFRVPWWKVLCWIHKNEFCVLCLKKYNTQARSPWWGAGVWEENTSGPFCKLNKHNSRRTNNKSSPHHHHHFNNVFNESSSSWLSQWSWYN